MSLLTVAAAVAALAQAPDPAAIATLDTAIARMGGATALRGIERARFELMTQWQRTNFDNRAYTDYPSYERHSDLRDYRAHAWRNTRQFVNAAPQPRYSIDVVVGDVAIRDGGSGFAPLNVAYVDERREVFAFSPDRVVVLARDARDLRAGRDTIIDGMAHTAVTATIDRFPATLYFRRTDGLPAFARFRAAQPNDFGLSPWGEMTAEVHYSNWRPYPGSIYLPTQLDVRRVGRPYKRTTVLGATFNPPATPDSFAVSDSLRQAFFATANRPMHDLPLDSARLLEPRLVRFGAFGAPAGAVKLGDSWLLLEAGQAPLNAQRALGWLQQLQPDADVTAAVITSPFAGNGGVVELLQREVTVHAAPLGQQVIATIARNAGIQRAPVIPIARGQTITVDGDAVHLEPFDLPNVRGTALVYVPSLHLLYSAFIASPLDLQLALARARELGWDVQRWANSQLLVRPVS